MPRELAAVKLAAITPDSHSTMTLGAKHAMGLEKAWGSHFDRNCWDQVITWVLNKLLDWKLQQLLASTHCTGHSHENKQYAEVSAA